MPLNPRLVKFRRYINGWVAKYNDTWVSNPHPTKELALQEVENILQDEADERLSVAHRQSEGLEMLEKADRYVR